MKIRSLLIAIFTVVSFGAMNASATMIEGEFSVSGDAFSDPGLVVEVAPNPGSFAVDLALNVAHSFTIFSIWTDESSVNSDDQNAQSINVSFDVTNPVGVGVLGGESDGHKAGFFGSVQWGSVSWNNPLQVVLAGGGLLQIELSNETFNKGYLWGTSAGEKYGADIEATFTLLRDSVSVPEPGTIGLLLLGLVGLGMARRVRSA